MYFKSVSCCILLYLAAGADMDAKDKSHETALLLAVEKGQEAVAVATVRAGRGTNAKDGFGNTPLHLAAVGKHVTLALALVVAGADKEAKNGDGETPLHLAAEKGLEAVALKLLRAGADKGVKDWHDGENERYTRAKWRPSAAFWYGSTPLHRAAANGHFATARALVAAGADTHAKDKGGRTPLYLATMQGHKALALMLIAGPPQSLLARLLPTGVGVADVWFVAFAVMALAVLPAVFCKALTAECGWFVAFPAEAGWFVVFSVMALSLGVFDSIWEVVLVATLIVVFASLVGVDVNPNLLWFVVFALMALLVGPPDVDPGVVFFVAVAEVFALMALPEYGLVSFTVKVLIVIRH